MVPVLRGMRGNVDHFPPPTAATGKCVTPYFEVQARKPLGAVLYRRSAIHCGWIMVNTSTRVAL